MNRTRAFTFGAASIAIAAAGTFGCNLLVSASDYKVAESGSDATTNEPDTSPIGNDGASGDTGPGADAHEAGPGGDASDAGACGSTLPSGTTAFQTLLKTCALDFGCGPLPIATSIGSCVADTTLGAVSGSSRCEQSALNCADIASCSGVGWATECDGGAHTALCIGDHATNCRKTGENFAPGYYFNCTKQGGSCGTYTDDAGPWADCIVQASCNKPNDGNYYCAGSDLYTCIGGKGYGQNCTQYQATCEDGGSGTSCYYNLPTCTVGATPACDGNTGQICFDTGLQRYDCSAGTHCVAADDPLTGLPFQCVADGCAATDAGAGDCTEACNGNTATVCVGNAPVTFDCTSIGMSCYTTTDSSGAITLAQCLPF